MKITSKGQMTIPQHFRKKYGLLPHSEAIFVEGREGLVIKKAPRAKGRGDKMVERLSGSGNGKWTTAQIMKLMRG